ncbi:dihydroxyacetone kinase subunit DhaK [Alicyclobacillus kakegawensis]|uniref:dihydroxyacetone kinase subunit DhaK n=1 Tax=Alicyclobacillus kakegawensis TaxID=392012 RepID=UPI000A92E381|nr:dihydroxyacetone kinase subunit DhaK [Alicyclobacillus kakegawensis]
MTKKLINHPDRVVEDMLAGFLLAHSDVARQSELDPRAIVRRNLHPDKVGIVIGGGSGHEPAFIGYLGDGGVDGVAVGNIFASPSPYPVLAAIKETDQGQGVLLIYGNYSGDCMNFSMAVELAEMEGHQLREIVVHDDVASAPRGHEEERRGIAGEILIYKVAGVKAKQGATLDEVYQTTEKANQWIRSVGVGLHPGSLPQTGKPNFELADDEMELGMGVHGEPGIQRTKMVSAREVARQLVTMICDDFDYSGAEVAVMLNGLGATSLLELYIVYADVVKELQKRRVRVYKSFLGEYITSQEMAGCSLTVLKLDDELKHLIDVHSDMACAHF